MKKASGIARSRAGRVGLVAGVAVATVVGLALPAGANTGHVYASQSCSDGWHASVTLDNNVALDHLVVVTTTIPGTTGLSGHYDTTHNSSTQQIWDASGSTVESGNVTLTIYNPNGSVDSTAQAWLPGVEDCHPTTSTTWAPTTTMQTTTTTCKTTTTTMPPTTTTWAPTTTTMPPTTTTWAPTTTTMPTTTTVAPTTTIAATTTIAPTTTTIAPTTTVVATTIPATTSSTSVSGTTVVTSTTKPATTTTVKEQGSTVPTTAAPTTTLPAATSQSLPFTGSSTTYPVIFGLCCVTAGGLLLLRKRSDWSRP